jgi:hypothetical protein
MIVTRFIQKIQASHNQQSGFILPVLLITGLMIMLMIVAVSSQSLTNHRTAAHANYAVEAQLAADAGLDFAMNRMNTTDNWTGTGGEVDLLNNPSTNIVTTYDVSVSNGIDDDHKTLQVTAKSYSPTKATPAKVTRKYAMDIQAVTTGTGLSSVVTGVGGLIMNGNSKVTGGDVVVDGTITASNGAQIGLSTNPVNVRVADQACPIPANSSYPQICGAGNPEPISLSNNSLIYGNVQAKNQVTGTHMFNPGLVSCAGTGCDPVTLTPFDRPSFKTTINASGQTMTGANASSCPNGGTVNWPANVKIIGNVSIQNKCTIKVNGNVWITGSVSIKNNADLKIQDSVGSTMPYMVVDGSSGFVIGNNGSITPNSSGTSIEILTFWSASSCTPECTSLSGTELYNSQGTLTLDLSNTGSAPKAILYAYWSKVRLSNNGSLGAVTGQTVELGNNAVINFSSSVPGSDNRLTTWVKRGYMRVYN